MESWWKTWPELRSAVKGKKIVLYGRAEDWIPKTIAQLPQKPAYIVDRNSGFAGSEYLGMPVVSPEQLQQEKIDDLFVIITSGSYPSIFPVLEGYGFEAGRHFCCTPVYRDFYRLEAIRDYKQEIIVASSDYKDPQQKRHSRMGGGIFRLIVGAQHSFERLVPGHFRQMTMVNDKIYAIEYVEMKLYVFDKNFSVIEKFSLDRPNYCGLAYDSKRNVIVLVNSGSDTIAFHDPGNFKTVDKIYYSRKASGDEAGQHHLNDACIDGDNLYVSYFSHSGNWKREVYDGGISEFNLNDLASGPVQVVRDLWMPHSPKIIEGNLTYCESMTGKLYLNSQAPVAQFQGFLRGLAFDGRYYFLGLSENMYAARLYGLVDTLMMNAGVYLFDKESRCSRFYPMLDNMNVHDLMIIEAESGSGNVAA